MTLLDSLPGLVDECGTADKLAATAAHWIAQLSDSAIAARGRFSIALAGGTTPARLYATLAAAPLLDSVRWMDWHVFFGDERACPPGDPSSNYQFAQTTLLGVAPIPAGQIHRMPADGADLDAAATEYSQLLGSLAGPDGIPRLDCILLGLGENGHTASLFPGTPALDVSDAWCTRGLADYEPFDRLTVTFPAINAARNVAFLVAGGKKAQALRDVVDGTAPAARVAPEAGTLIWFLDDDAVASVA